MVEIEFVEETVVGGLVLVYQKSDKETKDNLVLDLILSFTDESTRILTGNISAETKLFEPGIFPAPE